MDGAKFGFGLLKFCLEHSDDPQAIVNSQVDSNRDPKDYEFLVAALSDLESELEKATKLLSRLRDTQADDIFEIKACLEGLQYFCEDLDVSQGIIKESRKGMELVMTFLSHANEEVRFIAAWVLASILQSNAITQNYALQSGALEGLVIVMRNEENISAMSKQLYALSSFLSESLIATQIFVDHLDGLTLLHKYIDLKEIGTEEYIPVKTKTLWILNKILTNDINYSSQFLEMGTLSHLNLILKEDQNSPQILRNILSLIVALLKNARVVSYFKENQIPQIEENLCSEDDLENLQIIKNKLSS
jgi:hypothetical protein